MRIRSTKPEFWRSERIASVSWDARLVLKGLESFVDDNGAGKDDLALIVADVFPRDLSRNPTGTLQKVSEALSALSDAGLIWRYEHDGTRLLYIAFWEGVQRIEKPSKGRFRRPDGTLEYKESLIGSSFPEPSRNTPVALPSGTGEQGNRGTGEEPPSASASAERGAVDAEFAAWWSEYPRKRDKGHAVKAYRTARRKASAATLLEGLRRQLPELEARAEDKRPYAATWLNGDRWTDEVDQQPNVSQLPHASELESPPDGLSPREYSEWYAQQAQRRRA